MSGSDGKHPVRCVQCGGQTWTKAGTCKRCRALEEFSPAQLSEAQLEACARELLRRHNRRTELIGKLLRRGRIGSEAA